MRTDPITKEVFEPNTPEHYFKSIESFYTFIEQMDPMDEFEEKKREINWAPIVRKCSKCDQTFIATHPATMYCEDCREAEQEEVHVAKKEEEPKPGIIRR